MKEHVLLGALLAANPVVVEITNQVRKQFGIEKIDAADPEFAEYILNNPDIPWEEVRQELRQRFINYPDIFPPSLQSLTKHLAERPDKPPTGEDLYNAFEYTEEAGKIAAKTVFALAAPSFAKLSEFIDFNVDYMLAFLMTGETQPVPFDWFGNVFTLAGPDGEPVIYMMASRLSNPKEMHQKFMTEFNRVFGKDRPKITRGFMKTADLVRMKLAGTKIKDIADAYILRNPSQFPKDKRSEEYKAAKRKFEDKLKKNLNRYIDVFIKLLGEKTD